MEKFIAIDLAKPKGERIIINTKYVVSIRPTDSAWAESTGIKCYLSLSNSPEGIPCAESVTEILTRIKIKDEL